MYLFGLRALIQMAVGGLAAVVTELVIQKQRVDLESRAYQILEQERPRWATEALYRFPGPTQFCGPGADARPLTLQLNSLE